MPFREQIALLRRLDYFIQRKVSGTPMEIANRLGVSRSSLFRYLDELRNFGAEISYCRDRQCYYYKEPFQLEL